jgi:hypothetical protein
VNKVRADLLFEEPFDFDGYKFAVGGEEPDSYGFERHDGFDTYGYETYATREEALAASMAAHPAGKHGFVDKAQVIAIRSGIEVRNRIETLIKDERGDVPGWVLVVLMTTGLVTAIWAIAKPNLTNILNNSLNSMNSVK